MEADRVGDEVGDADAGAGVAPVGAGVAPVGPIVPVLEGRGHSPDSMSCMACIRAQMPTYGSYLNGRAVENASLQLLFATCALFPRGPERGLHPTCGKPMAIEAMRTL